jgi:hypothetical protein
VTAAAQCDGLLQKASASASRTDRASYSPRTQLDCEVLAPKSGTSGRSRIHEGVDLPGGGRLDRARHRVLVSWPGAGCLCKIGVRSVANPVSNRPRRNRARPWKCPPEYRSTGVPHWSVVSEPKGSTRF